MMSLFNSSALAAAASSTRVQVVLMSIICTTTGGLLVEASKVDRQLQYSTFSLFGVVQLLKVGSSVALHCRGGHTICRRPSMLFAIPALCYACSDNLAMELLQLVDPATMALFWNMKVVWTAILMRVVLGMRLTKRKAVALGALLLGLTASKADHLLSRNEYSSATTRALCVAALGTVAVSSGNVSYEWLMKRNDQPHLHWANLQLYLFGSMFNLLAGLLTTSHETMIRIAPFAGFNIWCLAIILNYSVAGIMLGAVLKFHDNITVIYCHTVAMILQTWLQHWLFGFTVTQAFAVGLLFICLSLRMYYHEKNPLPSTIKASSSVLPSDDAVSLTHGAG